MNDQKLRKKLDDKLTIEDLRELIPQAFLTSSWGTPMPTDNALRALVNAWKFLRDQNQSPIKGS